MEPFTGPPVDGALRRRSLELDSLNEQCALARTTLDGVRAQLALAQMRLEAQPMVLLREANEALVVAALEAHQRVQARERELDTAVRTLGLDPLTQLPNRLLLRDRFAQAAAAVRRHGGQMALLFVDLDHFKRINDLHGHAAGDQALCAVAEALVSAVRASDTVSRHGGDEFVVLLSHLADPADASAIAHKVLEALSTLQGPGGRALRLSASIGMAIHPDDGEDLDTLIDCADAAMYRGKRSAAAPLWRDAPDPVASHPMPTREPDQGLPPLRDVNERLVMAVLSARDGQQAAETAFSVQQTNLAVTAHELRNPLAPMSYALTLLKSLQDREPLVMRVQGILERQLAHMTQLVGDLLDVSRAATGRLRIQLEVIELRPLVDASVLAVSPFLQRRQQTLDLQVTAEPLRVRGDATRLVQVLGNLLDNASKYTPDGGSIRLGVARDAQDVVLTVADSGIGIAAEALPHVFDAFVQEERAADFNTDGMGIGLMVVHQLVQAHGGTVEARSRGRDRGSEFVVRLPLAKAAADA
jgi:diguanylate cyclase (GGDEF)-like protein